MSFQPTDLRTIPLFAHIPDDKLAQLVAAFERRSLASGEVLFKAGSIADRFVVLISGAIEATQSEEKILVRPVAPVGEVGALSHLRRATTAIAVEPSEVLTLP